MRLGSSPLGIHRSGNKLFDDNGNPASIVRGAVANVVLVGGVVSNPVTPPQPTQGLLWTADYDTMSVGTNLYPCWLHIQKPNYPGLSGPIDDNSMVIAPAADVPGSGDVYKPPGQAMKVTLQPYANGTGDVNASGSTNRAEVYDRFPSTGGGTPPGNWPDPVDSTRWYGFSVYVPSDFVTSSTSWFDLNQFKGYHGGSPPEAIEISNASFVLGGSHSRRTLGGINPGHWSRFEIGFHWSPVSTTGWVNIFLNGVEVLPQETRATMDYYGSQADPIYFKQGIYRSASWNTTAVLWFGPVKIGYTHADVLP